MNPFGWIIFLLIGAVAGFIASKIMGSRTNLLVNIIIGVLGIASTILVISCAV